MTEVKINIKTPCQEFEDREVVAKTDWTVRKIKREIESCWSHHPRPQDQRLVYAGKLLQDEWILSDFLRYDEGPSVETSSHTMHLICRQTSPPPIKANDTISSGLRQRKINSSPPSTGTSDLTDQGAFPSSTIASPNINQSLPNNAASSTIGSTIADSNFWQMYPNSQAALWNQNANYLNQTPEQALMMQQMYAHYMNQYMLYVQSGGMWPSFDVNAEVSGTNGPPAYAQQIAQEMQDPAGAAALNPVAAGAAVAAVVGGHTAGAPAGGQEPANQANLPDVAVQNAALPQEVHGAVPGAAAVQAMNGPGANPANVVMNAGAGGMGAMEEEDEDGMGGVGGQRDILDWFYIASRVLVLFSIVYFYSSLARFALVAGLGLVVYLYRTGFFAQWIIGQGRDGNLNNNNNNGNQDRHINRNRPNDEQRDQDQQGPGNRNEAREQDENLERRENNANGEPEVNQGEDDAQHPPVAGAVQLEQSWYYVATTFITTFFTSLVPNEPQVI